MKTYLVVGLGNIGPKYNNTRHNIGFDVLDALATEHNISFLPCKLGDSCVLKIKGRKVVLLKPSTFMNLSGKAVKYWLEKEKVPLEHLLIITDDLNLPFASLRLKTKGSDGGHNGLKDIQDKLQTTKYSRLRFGISNAFGKGKQVDYVLGTWSNDEHTTLKPTIIKATEIIKSFVLAGPSITMNQFNGQ